MHIYKERERERERREREGGRWWNYVIYTLIIAVM